MDKPICIFEDSGFKNFQPLTYTRPIYDLRCGIFTLKEKILNYLKSSNVILLTREYLADDQKTKNPGQNVNKFPAELDNCIFINGRLLVDNNLADKIIALRTNQMLVSNNEIAAANLDKAQLNKISNDFKEIENLVSSDGLSKIEIDATLVHYAWELVNNNGDEIRKDFNFLVHDKAEKLNGKIYNGTTFVNESKIFIGENSKIKPGVILDAEEGPIYIGKDVTIFPNVVIEGPCYIGDGSKIKVGAKIYENTSIGPVCKVGGEVEESIIHSYSNKQHDGFLGHAYLGSWVNLGADTNNSDLKNNYGNVKVFINDEQVDTGSKFVGLTMGDHSKCGINTMFNTGTVVGVSCNIYGGNFPPKYIPSFSWGGSEGFTTYKLDKSMAVAKKVMARRDVQFNESDENIFKTVFKLTQAERAKRQMPE
ncbi:UDP-3-O-[3-hydroxymyristoyl] glucosamine N-acyltransferase [bacterium BMS3Abin04]|nr:UDP-3-O-[3-hydroxymyristoyl] glucosamine N-acyltransferase [bacterium BMS3Abin04]